MKNINSEIWSSIVKVKRVTFEKTRQKKVHICSRLDVIPILRKKYILCNWLTGALDLVTEEEVKWLENLRKKGKVDRVGFNSLNSFYQRGHIFLDEKEETLFFLKLVAAAELHYGQYKYGFTIIPTYRCNLSCTYCCRPRNHHSIMTRKKVDAIFKAISEIAKNSACAVTLSGGEPILSENKGLLEYILSKGMETGNKINLVITNGVDVPYFIDVLSKSVKGVQITLDGIKTIHDFRRRRPSGEGSFQEVVEGIDVALKEGLSVWLRTNVDEQNLKRLPDLGRFIENRWKKYLENNKLYPYLAFTHGCKSTHKFMITDIVNGVRKVLKMVEKSKYMYIFSLSLPGFSLITDLYKGKSRPPRIYRCGAYSNLAFVFEPQGKISTCRFKLADTDCYVGTYYPTLKIKKDKMRSLRGQSLLFKEKCFSCKYGLLCGGGGCNYLASVENRNSNVPYCFPFKQLVPLYIRFLYKMGTARLKSQWVLNPRISKQGVWRLQRKRW